MFTITPRLSIPDHEIKIEAVRSSGPGGQNVNKVSSAVHLRFNIPASSLPEECKERLLRLNDNRVTRDGTIIIKAQRFRSLSLNRKDALNRLGQFLRQATGHGSRVRKPSAPSLAARRRRLDEKRRRGRVKQLRQKIWI